MDILPPLDRRDRLPDALRVLVREFPRDGWSTHPNFGGMVSFWLERHQMFRRLDGLLQSETEAAMDGAMDPETYRRRLAQLAGTLLNELHAHHHIEDSHYFPRLMTLDARIERGFDLLEADHGAMDGLIHGMADAANAVLQGQEPGPFLETTRAFGRLLGRHLEDEEELVVPVILKSGFEG